jgi:flavin reductase (DIM6/NTAB) family NADH-FMN oxidoreductase RutF
VLAALRPEVTVITVDHEGEIHEMTATAVTPVSLDLLLFCVARRNY